MQEGRMQIVFLLSLVSVALSSAMCPLEQEILPCSCKTRGSNVLISCRHAAANEIKIILGVIAQRTSVVDEVMLADNYLPKLSADIFETSPHIHRLLLWNNGIQRVENSTFSSLGLDIRELHVREPRLTDIPKDMLVSMVQLRKLTVEHTPLSKLPELNFCQSLVEVYLDDTRIAHLPRHSLLDLHDLRVVELKNSWLSDCSFESLHNLPSLQVVNLTGNYISSLNASSWKYLPKLEAVDLRKNFIQETISWLSFFETLKSLRILHLDQNQIRTFDVKLVTFLPNLVQLTLSNNSITEILNENSDKLSNIEELDLSSNSLKFLPENFFRRIPALRVLRLNNNPLNATLKLETVLTATKAKVLDLEYCELRNLSLTNFQRHYFIEKLSLRGNLLRSLPLHAVNGLMSLTELDLSRNHLSKFMDELENSPRTKTSFSNREQILWKFPALRAINLSENEIRTISPAFFQLFPSIRSMILQQNNITEVSVLEYMKNLVYLDLSRNRLKQIDEDVCKKLGKLETLIIKENNLSSSISLKDCYTLRALDLSRNSIKTLPATIFQSNLLLLVLNLSFNILTAMPNVRNLLHITKLLLAHNNIETLQADDLINNNNLEIIDLSNNLISEVPPGFFVSKRLEKVDLSHNRIVSLAANTFNTFNTPCGIDLSFNQLSTIENGFFTTLQTLQRLNMSHNNLKSVNFGEMEALTKIRVLDLNSNRLEDIRNLSVRNIPSLVEIDLSNNSITSIRGSEFSNSRALMRVDLSRNSIQQLPLNAFSSLPHLEELILANNKLQTIPSHVFNNLMALEYLGLNSNFIESIDQDAFSGLCLVRYLNLNTNNIIHLDKTGVRNLYSVEILDLSNNNIKELNEKSLRRLERLIYLNLDENNITRITDDFLKYQSQLIKVSLRGNSLKDIPEKLLLPENLRQVNLDENPLQCNCGLLRMLEKLSNSQNGFAKGRPSKPTEQFLSNYNNNEDIGDFDYLGCQALLLNASRSICHQQLEGFNEAHLNPIQEVNRFSIPDKHLQPNSSMSEVPELTDGRSNVSTIYAKLQNNCTTGNNPSATEEDNKSPNYVNPQLPLTNQTYQHHHSRIGLNLLPAVLNTGAWISRIIDRFSSASRPTGVLPINQIGSEVLQMELYPGLTPAQILEFANNHFNFSLLGSLESANNSTNSKPQYNISNSEILHLLPATTTTRPAANMMFPQYSTPVKTVKFLDFPIESAKILALQANHEWNPLVSCDEHCKHSSNLTHPENANERDTAANVSFSTQLNERVTSPVISFSGSIKDEKPSVVDAHGYEPLKGLAEKIAVNDTVPPSPFEGNSTFNQLHRQVAFEKPPNFLKVSKVVMNDSTVSNAYRTVANSLAEIRNEVVFTPVFDDNSVDEGPSIPEFAQTGQVYHIANDFALPISESTRTGSRQVKTSPNDYFQQIGMLSLACKSYLSPVMLIVTTLTSLFCMYNQ